MKQTKTGILFFSRSTQVEARMKNWRTSFSVNLSIAQHLIQSTHTKLSNTGLDVIEIDESSQRGQTFGAKIAHAFEDGFALGYDRLILVGNDCIGLTSEDIIKGAEQLNHSNCVLGPAKNGGLYLIGLEP